MVVYLRPFLETVTHVDVPTLTLRLIIGAAGLEGTMLVGLLVTRNLNRTLVAIPLMAAIAFAVIAAGTWVVPVAVLLGVWGAGRYLRSSGMVRLVGQARGGECVWC